MPHLKGLRMAIDLAARRRDDAVAALQQVRHAHAMSVGQLQQLESYAAETEARWALASRAMAHPEILGHYGQFMERLRQAVDMQRAVVDGHVRETEEVRQRLVEEDVKLCGLKRLLDKRRAAVAHALAGREQKQLDELAALQFRRLHPGAQLLEPS